MNKPLLVFTLVASAAALALASGCSSSTASPASISTYCATSLGGAPLCYGYSNLTSDQQTSLANTCKQSLMGTVVTSCPTASLVGCCTSKTAGIATEECYYGADSGTADVSGYQAACSATSGTWSTMMTGGGGNDGGSNPVPENDAGTLPCEPTGTCDGGTPTTQCQMIGSCSDGESYSTCTTNTGGACSASIVFSGGAQTACASCTNCEAASASAVALCNSPVQDAAPPVEAGPVCGATPVLHPELAPGVYCPFTAAGAVHCPAGQECCEAPAGSFSTCQPVGAACPLKGSLAWECADPLDCQGNPAGAACCGIGGTTTFDSTCGFHRGSGFTGSQCAASCGAGQLPICSAASNSCVSPAQCTPFKVAGLVLGTCL